MNTVSWGWKSFLLRIYEAILDTKHCWNRYNHPADEEEVENLGFVPLQEKQGAVQTIIMFACIP